uniref:Uncharacterized protein n=1 Tax=Anguilla anguilla TaxID=7936 RepID=A0A0E9QYB0_ANGAN
MIVVVTINANFYLRYTHSLYA